MKSELDHVDLDAEEEHGSATALAQEIADVLNRYSPQAGASALASLLGCNVAWGVREEGRDLEASVERVTEIIAEVARKGIAGDRDSHRLH